ncbi:MAG: methionine gamma-lyase family protein, partial [Oscillospiraceae bacterium]|nr:methionine gamma-lyase family protein [Oscillospiraceae bacterium]
MKTEEYLDFCTAELAPVFRRFEAVERVVFRRVQEAFRRERVQQSDFMGSTGYGYGDVGRDKLGRVFARAFECEDALVRPQIMSGTHAISTALFGLLRHGDTMLCVSGEPYDTLKSAISAFPQFGIHYEQTELIHSGLDYESIKNRLAAGDVKMVYAQRSRGYASRRSLLPDELGRLAQLAHGIDKNIIVMVDNCYGEFVLEHEPTYYGADVIAGSLIKNAGGGLAPTGGYIAGKREYVETAAERLTVPGIGREIGSYEAGLRLFYQGLFIAPHTVCEALKNAALIALALYGKGYRVSPAADEARTCIV